MKISVSELRDKFLRFFEGKNHQFHASGSLVPYDVQGNLDESLLFNGAGMVQFKPYFRGSAKPPHPRLITVQKCLRTGDIEEVGDDSHLTFFEMLGNFSFGDYFKEGAIGYSWEFLTSSEWLGLDPNRLAFTYYCGDEDSPADAESHERWSYYLKQAGIDPESRVFGLGEESNVWPAGAFSSGPPGPCGPNTEMFYWTSDEPAPGEGYTREDFQRDEKEGKWLEIWNDVFIQYEWKGEPLPPNSDGTKGGYRKLGMADLPFKSVDTGMGLERTACVLSGLRSVYETDAFEPLLSHLDELTKATGSEDELCRAKRIIADHSRSACFCIADGVLPSNTGRGYVLRRLIRRAILKGQRTLGIAEPFMDSMLEPVQIALADHYSELHERAATIRTTLQQEEDQFRRTLAQGTRLLEFALKDCGEVLAGSTAFRLYDTYGFPLEVTVELAAEQGKSVDLEGYRESLKEAQERSRGVDGMAAVYSGDDGGEGLSLDGAPAQSVFLGYTQSEAQSRLVRLLKSAKDEKLVLLGFEQTPFYAESGGQIGDRGWVQLNGTRLAVTDTQKKDGFFWHTVEAEFDQLSGYLGLQASLTVDLDRQRMVSRNHTATHLLHAALRKILGDHVTQAGSLVAEDHLRFDFTHGKGMSASEIEEVERLVNEWSLNGESVEILDNVPIAEARKMGAMALFGEKYGDYVRVVRIGEVSTELCGGIHVGRASDIGLFKIRHEMSIASGVRRIEAVTGMNSYELVRGLEGTTAKSAELLKTNPSELVEAVERALAHSKALQKKLDKLMASGSAAAESHKVEIGGVELQWAVMDTDDAKGLTAWAERLASEDPKRIAVAVGQGQGKLVIVAKAGTEAVSAGVKAGDLVKALAAIGGGSGGGRPDFGNAGAKDVSKLDEIAAAIEPEVRKFLQ
ncbi:MAG: alanine--tRNA ligase [Fimbriimonadaceae bacterium]